MNILFVAYGLVLLVLAVWYARQVYANNRTYDQRLAIIESWDFLEDDAYLSAVASFRSVAYSDHKREVFWGRDPYKLYTHLREAK